ncbi:MAG: aldo/keto reductase [Anaerolineales bacterium]|jgi:aryl-alcohol dehydrogenase-like predicted oxidoreductase
MQRTLGKSNLTVSALGLGCWAIGGPWTWAQPGQDPFAAGWGQIDDDESIRAIHAGLDAGINFFDTAANYGAGHSERILGEALRGRRDQVVIATKFGHIVNEQGKTVYGDNRQIQKNVRSDVENSLRRLQTDWIDIYQLHEGGYEPEPALELRDILEELVRSGKIRWYGWSTDLVDRAQVFADGEHCTSIQFRLNAIYDNPEMRQLCAANQLVGINKDPLNKGILTGKFTADSTFPADDIRAQVDFRQAQFARRLQLVDDLRDVLTSGGRTMAQGALAFIWALDGRMVPIPGFKSVRQVQENTAAMEYGPLSAAQVEAVQGIVAEYAVDSEA